MTYHIGFFADTHLGYRARVRNNAKGINIRVQDGYDALREIITQIENSDVKIDAVVHGGDLFHTSHPSMRDVFVGQWATRRLASMGIPFYGIAGNHDANDIRAEMAAVTPVNDPDKGIHALYEPYKAFELADGILLHAMSHHGLKADEAPQITPVDGAINLFTTHGAALDPKNQTLMRCADSPREQFVPLELVTDDRFQAKMLGHYHSRTPIGDELFNTWYSGSTIRRGFSDAPGSRGWLLVSIEPDGTTTITPKNIKQRPQYDLSVIDAAGKSASEVMDLLEVNIKGTQGVDQAPIVRQRIVNATRGIREGLDKDRIDTLTKHMLLWQLEKFRPEDDKSEKSQGEDKEKASLSRSKSLDIVSSFNGWVKEQTKGVPEEYRDAVATDAEEYLKQAYATGFADGHGH